MLSDDFHAAMQEACRRHKTQKAFADATGIHQSRISAYATGKIRFEELSVSTLIRLFPEMKIDYFPAEKSEPQKNDDQELREVVKHLMQRVSALETKNEIKNEQPERVSNKSLSL